MASKVLKLLIVGDGAIGKSCLLTRIQDKEPKFDAEAYEPTTFDNYLLDWEVEEDGVLKMTQIALWDSAGQEAFKSLREMSYAGTDIHMVGYACDNLISLNNIPAMWIPEITRVRKEAGENDEPWVVLIGTKEDIRSPDITPEKSKEIASTINACAFVDTSAKNKQGVPKLLQILKHLVVMKKNGAPKPSWEDFDENGKYQPATKPAPATGGPSGSTGGSTGGSSAGPPPPAPSPPAPQMPPTAQGTPGAKTETTEEDKGCCTIS